jgi:hypothetical protein
MGIRYPQIASLLENAVRDEVSQDFTGLTMIELGEQNMTGDTKISLAKNYFSEKGFLHTSFDIKSTGSAVEVDLSKPVNSYEQADIVTNFGTTEHIFQGDNPQYHAYRNVHNFTKKGGVMFHFVPTLGSWPNHCDYWYKLSFFETLFNLLDYRAVVVEHASDSIPFYKPPKDMCIAVAVKQNDNAFLTEEAFSPLYKMLEIKANRN